MLDWLIIGGGIQGMTLTLHFTNRLKIPHNRIRVLDPHTEPLALWRQFTANTGMRYLRSPKVHHLHDDPFSITTFAQTKQGKPLADYIPLYQRPSLEFFNAYCDYLIERFNLADLRLIGRAKRLIRAGEYWQVQADQGVLESKNIILAMGTSEQPHYPEWSLPLIAEGTPIQHIFQHDFRRDKLSTWDDFVIIGGGISAAQLAISLAKHQTGTITLLMRHEPRITHFDSDPCWVTNLCLEKFHAEKDYMKRREIIQQARNRGSMPLDVFDALENAVDRGEIQIVVDEVVSAKESNQKVTLSTKANQFLADRVILATGFETKRPGGQLVDDLIQRYDLSIAPCGYPIIDETLCWSDGLYVSGALAELEVGPVARNIIGARLSAAKISQSIRKNQS